MARPRSLALLCALLVLGCLERSHASLLRPARVSRGMKTVQTLAAYGTGGGYGGLGCVGAYGNGGRYGGLGPQHVAAYSNATAGAPTRVVDERDAPQFHASKQALRYAAVGISNRGAGPVLRRTIPVYLVWVGTLSARQKTLVRTFVRSLNPSADKSVTVDNWWNINTRYYGGRLVNGKPTGGAVSPRLTLRGEWTASAAALGMRGGQLGDIFGVVKKALKAKGWPADPDAIYAVFSGKDVTQVGAPGAPYAAQCVDYCGWHYYGTYAGKRLVYAWQGVPNCMGCGSPLFSSNGGSYAAASADAGIHQAISTLAHELAEAASDPYLTSWYDARGYENADKCQAYFGRVLGTQVTGGRTGIYNLVGQGGAKFLIQQNWDPISGSCATAV